MFSWFHFEQIKNAQANERERGEKVENSISKSLNDYNDDDNTISRNFMWQRNIRLWKFMIKENNREKFPTQ